MVSYRTVIYISAIVLVITLVYGIIKVLTYGETKEIIEYCDYIITDNKIKNYGSYQEFLDEMQSQGYDMLKSDYKDAEIYIIYNKSSEYIAYNSQQKAAYEVIKECKKGKSWLEEVFGATQQYY